MGAHAILGPSASDRWLQCPASIRMIRDLPVQEEVSVYAQEGTQFHTLCELTARYRLLGGPELDYLEGMLQWAEETDEEWQEEQLRRVLSWLLFLKEAIDEDPDALVLLEERVDTGVPGCWGTADVVIISREYGWVRVIDIKYGSGIRVNAVENSQLMLYGLGALGLVEDPLEIDTITMSIWQPRMDNYSDYTLTRKELLNWRGEIVPTAKLALSEDAPFGPSDTTCRWCPVSGNCSARTKSMLAADFGDPDLLSGEEMAEAVARVPGLKRWAADIEDEALKQAYEKAGSVPGFKVVRSGGRRKIMDEPKAIEALIEAGYDKDAIAAQKLATLGTLDTLSGGAEKLQQVLGDLVVKSEGRLSLTPDSDPRPAADAIHSAEMDFADIKE